MRAGKRTRTVLVSGVLLVGLVGVLILNLAIAADLPSRVYTAQQMVYLDYNRGRSISQVAPAWNLVTAEGDIQPLGASYIRQNRVRARLFARYEQQDRVSVTVYDLEFRGEYVVVNDGPAGTMVELFFPFPGNLETLHEVGLLVDGTEPPGVRYTIRGIHWQADLGEGEERAVEISYRADGATSFGYRLNHGRRTDVDVEVEVVGLDGSSVPKSSLPTTSQQASGDGEILTWDYAGLIVDRDVQLMLPVQLSFAQRVAELQDDFRLLASLAPVLVGLFLASLAAVCRLGQVRLGLERYLLAGFGLALFFPLLIFLSGLVGLLAAAILALVLVSGLLLVFLGLAAGWHWVRWRVGLLLLIFLGFFGLGVLSPWQGLMLTAGGLLLVGMFMLLCARQPAGPELEPELPDGAAIASALATGAAKEGKDGEPAANGEPAPEQEVVITGAEETPDGAVGVVMDVPDLYCPFCARALEGDYGFCPGCGQETQQLCRCGACGSWQLLPEAQEAGFCLQCGETLS